MATEPTLVSSYLDYLPAIFRQDEFIGRFLLAFEKLLSGLNDPGELGLEEIIDRIHTYFDPGAVETGGTAPAERAPDEFLPWLAGWVALNLREDWDTEAKRRFISRIVPLYQKRGTKAGLKLMLSTYTGLSEESIKVYEFDRPAHYFQVEMTLEEPDPDLRLEKEKVAIAIINQEKPAHTYYGLHTSIPTMQIGVSSTVGVDTILGTPAG